MVDTFREPLISVGILTNTKVTFELYGDFKTNVSTKNTNGIFTAEIINGEIVCNSVKVKLTSKDELIFEPNDLKTDTFLIRDVTIGVKFHWERKQKQRFSGLLKLKKDKDEIAVINILPIENYLSSVISSEMSAKSSLQLLKAHAIVSRSWLLAQIEKSRSLKKAKAKYSSSFESDDEHIKWYDREDHDIFDVCADDHCQRYQGITGKASGRAAEAVRETRGVFLLRDGEICDARYHKACGGLTEDYATCWEEKSWS